MLKKQMIMERALELFADQGFKATSVEKITEYCGISKGAFYLSFTSKDELIYAIIDHFMMKHTTKLDQIVNSHQYVDENNLLFKFYQASYESVDQHADFSKFFMQDVPTLNQQLIERLAHYDRMQEKIILTMIERLYGKSVNFSKYDLLFCIKSFMKMYIELILFRNLTLDIELLADSLVEKTNILAKHMQIPFITSNQLQHLNLNNNLTKEDLTELIEEKIDELEDSIEKESLVLLLQHFRKEHLPPAIVKGLIENIRNNEECKWIAFLLMNFFE